MSGQTWTPAPKKGVIPLHPLTFGMLLGRSFAALRHNPKALFGFAVLVQLVNVVVAGGVMGFVIFTTFTRLETLTPSSPDYGTVLAGTVAMNIVAGIAVSLASVAFTAMMQGVVAAEVGFAAVGVKASLGMLWRRMAPAFWRLVAFSLLAAVVVFGVLLIVFAVIAGLLTVGGGEGGVIALTVIIVVLLVIAAIPLTIWLSTKLLLVPSALVLERATLRDAIVRSWRLIRGRFWVAWGVTIVIGLIMGAAMQVVSIPSSLLSTMITGVITPTAEAGPSAIIGFLVVTLASQIVVLIIQAITLVVQSTAGTLVYLDSRMRYEGLDQALIGHVERRDLGWTPEQLGDPFAVDPAKAVSSAPPPRQVPEWAVAQAAFAGAQQVTYAPVPVPGQPIPPGYAAAPAVPAYPSAPPAQAYPTTSAYPTTPAGQPDPSATPTQGYPSAQPYPTPLAAPSYQSPPPYPAAPPAGPAAPVPSSEGGITPPSSDTGWAAPGSGSGSA